MTRIERIRNMTVKEIAKVIIDNNITDEFCRSQCENDEECLHDLECCIKWLEMEVKES